MNRVDAAAGARLRHAPIAADDERFRLLVESVNDYAIYLLDPAGRIVSWNRGAERIKGYRADEILGQHFSVFYPPDDIAAGKPQFELAEAMRVGRYEDEGWRIRKDGSHFWANVVISALREEDGSLRGFAKVTRDLTARREAEETARQLAAAEAARAAAEKGEVFQRRMLAIVGHDLRNSLHVVMTAADMARDHVSADPEALRRDISRIAKSAHRMNLIIRSLIDFTHAQHAEGIPIDRRENADFHEVCERVLQVVKTLFPSREVVYAAEGCPLGCWDEGRLEQVVENLVVNALKYGAPGSPVSL